MKNGNHRLVYSGTKPYEIPGVFLPIILLFINFLKISHIKAFFNNKISLSFNSIVHKYFEVPHIYIVIKYSE